METARFALKCLTPLATAYASTRPPQPRPNAAGELLTDVPRERWTLWHSIRRKWATERKGYPVREVMEAGGWKNEETLLRSYQQPDAETVRQVVLHPTQRIVSR